MTEPSSDPLPDRAAAKKAYMRRWYLQNREKSIQRALAWKAANPERAKAVLDQWRAENKTRIADVGRAWRAKNKERVLDNRRAWNERNPEKRAEIVRGNHERYYAKPGGKLAVRLRSRLRKMVMGRRRPSKIIDMVGCDHADLVRHIERQFAKGMTWENASQWHIDHIRPCSSFDLTNEQHVKECFHFTNLRPIWAKANLVKNGKRLHLL